MAGSIVVLDGIVASTWKFQDDLFARLAIYRNPYDPQKNKYQSEKRDLADYVVCRFEKGYYQNPSGFSKGTQIHIQGILESVDSVKSLQEFLEGAKKDGSLGDAKVDVTGKSANLILEKRSFLQILVKEFSVSLAENKKPHK
jgi:hypothetical protein